jgi:hypothetical protein
MNAGDGSASSISTVCAPCTRPIICSFILSWSDQK